MALPAADTAAVFLNCPVAKIEANLSLGVQAGVECRYKPLRASVLVANKLKGSCEPRERSGRAAGDAFLPRSAACW